MIPKHFIQACGRGDPAILTQRAPLLSAFVQGRDTPQSGRRSNPASFYSPLPQQDGHSALCAKCCKEKSCSEVRSKLDGTYN